MEVSLQLVSTVTIPLSGPTFEIVDSIADLLSKTDVILLETNDGRRHLEQALPVIKAGKPLFIDKPIAASLTDAIAIFEAAKRYNVHLFSSIWLAGGGIKPGITYGETDELGYYPVSDKVHIHDLHATILHQLGFDHEKLTYKYQGRDFRLTDVAGKVVTDLLV